jgi:hypothetical protein
MVISDLTLLNVFSLAIFSSQPMALTGKNRSLFPVCSRTMEV